MWPKNKHVIQTNDNATTQFLYNNCWSIKGYDTLYFRLKFSLSDNGL